MSNADDKAAAVMRHHKRIATQLIMRVRLFQETFNGIAMDRIGALDVADLLGDCEDILKGKVE